MYPDKQLNYGVIVQALVAWFQKNARALPWRQTRDPYGIWVSEIMLQQTRASTVIPYWNRWMQNLPDVRVLASATPERIHKLWEGLGYYTRVRNMHRAARIIVEQHCAEFPNQFANVLALPGIGPYTAGAICSIAFDQPTPILDGNVIRVLTRLYGIKENSQAPPAKRRLWTIAGELVAAAQEARPNLPSKAGTSRGRARCPHRAGSRPVRRGEDTAPCHERPCSAFNQALMELGALICTPGQPQCALCPVASQCVAFRHGLVTVLPNLPKRPTPTGRRFVALVAQAQARFFVRQRPEGVVNAHLWEFPNLEIEPKNARPREAVRKLLGRKAGRLDHLCTIKHSITRYRMTLEVFRVTAKESLPFELRGHWASAAQLKRLAFPSAHRKIVECLSNDE